ncbi:UNVERIFIED_CONTAM: cobalt/nickel transport system permease protein [Acetivibrio alkalicellulosi]
MKKKNEKRALLVSIVIAVILGIPVLNVYGMHIMEGFLPPVWCISWGALCIPFLVKGYFSIKNKIHENSRMVLILAMCGAFAFVLSALKLPSMTGSCSHPTGVGLGTIIFGPSAMAIISSIVLIFQAVLLNHGGLTTLGANIFSMGVAGPLATFGIFILLKKFGVKRSISVFTAAFIGNILTYMVTSFQLSIAFPDIEGGVFVSLVKFLGIFAVTQIPLAISEGLLTVIVYDGIKKYSTNELAME